jgi:RNA polymerase sigma-70 factor (ECF subfamily)
MRTADLQPTLEHAVTGDRAAQERLLLGLYEPITKFIEPRLPKSLCDTTGVEDILQQTFIKAFRGITGGDFRSIDAFLAWLRTIATTCIVDEVRKSKRKKRGGEMKRVPGRQEGDGSILDLLDIAAAPSGTPSGIVARKEAVQALQLALAQLDDDHRAVLTFVVLQGKDFDEVARQMDRSPDAVRGLLYRAKKELRAQMGRSSLYLSR